MTWDPTRLPDQTGRTIVVTGSTAGIGYFAAEQLAAAGADVVLASRSPDKLRRAATSIRSRVPQARVRHVGLELGSLAAVDEAAAELALLPRLDAVLLNGGAMSMNRRELTADGLPLLLGTHVAAARGSTNNTTSSLLLGCSAKSDSPHSTHPAKTHSPESHIWGVTVRGEKSLGPRRVRERHTP